MFLTDPSITTTSALSLTTTSWKRFSLAPGKLDLTWVFITFSMIISNFPCKCLGREDLSDMKIRVWMCEIQKSEKYRIFLEYIYIYMCLLDSFRCFDFGNCVTADDDYDDGDGDGVLMVMVMVMIMFVAMLQAETVKAVNSILSILKTHSTGNSSSNGDVPP